jgi:AraC family transcriptional regulator
MAFDKEIPKEYSKRINEVINFILINLREDLPLGKLAEVANYSPFHFQKIFKQITGESPKQFIIRTRLETAGHFLIIQHEKSVKEIAFECGFSSSATFARAFKTYFGIAAEQLRKIPEKERLKLYKKGNNKKQLIQADTNFKNVLSDKNKNISLDVVVKKILPVSGIFATSLLETISDIENAFKKVFQLAETNDLIDSNSKFIGVIYLHQNSYKAVLSTNPDSRIPKTILTTEINGGKYATYRVKGDLAETFKTLKMFTESWLPENGYRLADIFGFEILSENPLEKSYIKTEREIHIPIVPA